MQFVAIGLRAMPRKLAIDHAATLGTRAARGRVTQLERITMKEINAQHLETVAGGIKKSDAITQQLTQVTSSIKELASQNNNGSSSTTTMLMLAMAMQNRNQTVVAAPSGCAGCTVVQPAFSFRARFRF